MFLRPASKSCLQAHPISQPLLLSRALSILSWYPSTPLIDRYGVPRPLDLLVNVCYGDTCHCPLEWGPHYCTNLSGHLLRPLWCQDCASYLGFDQTSLSRGIDILLCSWSAPGIGHWVLHVASQSHLLVFRYQQRHPRSLWSGPLSLAVPLPRLGVSCFRPPDDLGVQFSLDSVHDIHYTLLVLG